MNLKEHARRRDLELVKNIPLIIDAELSRTGANITGFCGNERVLECVEQKLRGVTVAEGSKVDCVPASNIIIYSKKLETILDSYGSLEIFWKDVCKAVNAPLACMILHEDATVPHVHLLFRFDKVVSLTDIAWCLDEFSVNKMGQAEVRTHSLDYLYSNLYISFNDVLQCDDKTHGEEAVSVLLEITPAFAEYLVKFENNMFNTLYKEHLREEKEKHGEY